MNIDFHFGIEINTWEFLWIHGSVGNHCFKWILRRFWTLETWVIDDDPALAYRLVSDMHRDEDEDEGADGDG